MDKYIMPKLTRFDAKRYLNIDFSSEDIMNPMGIFSTCFCRLRRDFNA